MTGADTGASYEGGCHCGAIRWRFTTRLAPPQWPVRACQCSFCRAHAARCTSDPQGSVDFYLNEPHALQRYRFAYGCAQFLVCTVCGVYIGAVIEDARGMFATLNLNTMTTGIQDLGDAVPVVYDSEARDERIARRQSRWTPVTTAV